MALPVLRVAVPHHNQSGWHHEEHVTMIRPRAIYTHPFAGHLLVLEAGELPTTDYYLTTRLHETSGLTWSRLDVRDPLTTRRLADIPPGTLVVIVRQAPRRVVRLLSQIRDRLCGVAWLVDDDIPGVLKCQELPFGYRLRTGFRYWWQRSLLEKVCSRIWVATPALQQRYTGIPTVVLPPLPYQVDRAHGEREPVWFYHGTASHRADVEWLVPVVRQVQQACPDVVFEVSGTAPVAQLFQGIPRVRLLPPMSWPDFFAHTSRVSYVLGVAPLLPSRFNAVRSHAKFFDITRCGAVGVFSDRSPYRSVLPEKGAVLLPNDQRAWADAIIALLRDETRRMELFTSAVSWCRQQQGGLPL